MNKDEWIWVAIKIFGIFLIVMAIIALPNAIASIYAYISMAPYADHYNSEAANETSKLFNQFSKAQFAQGVKAIAQVLIYTGFGIYFIKSGKLIHNLLSRTK